MGNLKWFLVLGAVFLSIFSSPLMAGNVQINPYAIFASTGSINLSNISTINITGDVRAQASTATFNNLSSLNITGSVASYDRLRFNNISSGRVTGTGQSQTSVSVARGTTITGGSSVVSSIGARSIIALSAPSSTTDANYLTPITIVTGDYTTSGAVALNGTVYATGDVRINSGTSITGTGSIVSAGSIHISNVSSVGGSSAKIFLYSIGGDVHVNNVSSFSIQGGIYSPNGSIHLNNVSTLTVAGGIFGQSLDLNNISSLTVGPGSFNSGAIPPGIDPTVTISNPCSACGTSGGNFAVCVSSTCGYVVH